MTNEKFIEIYNEFYMDGKVQVTDINQITDWENRKAFMEFGIKNTSFVEYVIDKSYKKMLTENSENFR